MLIDLIRPHYKQLKGYVSAGMEADKSIGRIYMNANENPYDLTGIEDAYRYPEPQPKALLQAYSQAYQVSQGHIVMTRGADEAIAIITRLFCEPNTDAICIQSPTFGMYGVNAKSMPGKVIDVPLNCLEQRYSLDAEKIIAAAQDPQQNVKLIYICSPNNPTANLFDTDSIARICRETEGYAAVILDETYIEFSQSEGFAQQLAEFENLIILRTLSKSYAMAGMRMGSLLCANQDLINLIRYKCLDAYPLPVSSVNAALKVLSKDNLEAAKLNRQKLIIERNRIVPQIEQSQLVECVYPSDANFILVKMASASQFIQYCIDNGVILRDFSDKPSTKGCIRISISLPEHNDKLLELLSSFESGLAS